MEERFRGFTLYVAYGDWATLSHNIPVNDSLAASINLE